MERVDSKVFRSGNSEAVRLPKEVAFGRDIDVTITRIGETLTIVPKKRARMTPRELVEALRRLPVPDRVLGRDPVEPPERPGL
jgi:antitoxin VapB